MVNKKILIFILLLPFLGISQGINFEKGSFQQAFNKAKSENKVLFVDGYAVWCGPCKRMAQTVFLEEEVGAYFNTNFVSYKLDIEKGNGPKLKEKYGIQGLPGYVFIDANDEVVYRFDKAMPAAEFLKEAQNAMASANDPDSVGRLAELYNSHKTNEAFVQKYLNKLLDVKTPNYTTVLEQFLKIQKTIPESGKAMVMLLVAHQQQIVFGGQAERIINENIKTDTWKLYVRKDIREIFQKLPRRMVQQTTDYAVAMQDTTILELAIKNADKQGYTSNENQIKKTYKYYYKQVGNAEKYKALAHEDIVAYMKTIDKENLRSYYEEWLIKVANKDPDALKLTPFSVRRSNDIYVMVKDYLPFVKTETEKQDVLNWMETAYYIRPGATETMDQYANVQYIIGNKNLAIKVKEEAYQAALNEGLKRAASIKAALDLMKAGENLDLTGF
ncbi:MAG: thioredoxin fold domain-containing protein [Flavobacteriaceae bacterium]